jgi:hypothetical protein
MTAAPMLRPENCPVAPPRENGEGVIELKLAKIGQMFISLDPSPFHEKELDAEAERFIYEWARDLGGDRPVRLVVLLPAEEMDSAGAAPLCAQLPEAVRNHFAYRLVSAERELRHELRRGRSRLVIGLAFLAACFGLRELVTAIGETTWTRLLGEGLLLLGWVSLWGPLEVYLYGWWPVAGKRRLLRRLAAMPVELKARR